MFVANLTIGSVSTKTASNGSKYSRTRATIHNSNGTSNEVTVMAFGAQREAVSAQLRKGRNVRLLVAKDGKVLKAIGLPREAAPAAAEG